MDKKVIGMDKIHTRIIDTILKPPWKRSSVEIQVALPWLQSKSALLKELDKDILSTIVRNCNCLQAEDNDIIITQGDKGDKFYIILSGHVSVYVDAKKSTNAHLKEAYAQNAADVEQRAMGITNNPPSTPTMSDNAYGRMGSSIQGDLVRPELSTLTSSMHPTIPEHGMPGESEIVEESSVETPDLVEVTVQGKASSRRKYGEFLVKFGEGKCFGEIALISSDSVRNATIIADDECSFLVIKRYLYNSTVKAFQEEEYADRAAFVKSNPLFKTWHPKFKKLLEMSLIKEVHGFDSTVIKQGEEWKGIYFLRKGKADIIVEPSRHSAQYPEMKPFRNTNDVFEVELGIPNNRLSPVRKHNEFDRNRTKAVEHIFVRRHDGYAAAEKRVSSRCVELCSIGQGEMFGDIELVMNLPSYFHGVVSKSQTEFYVLTAKNYDRLVTKRYPNTLDTVRMFVETKLKNRSASRQAQDIPLLHHLMFRISGNMKSLKPPESPLVVRNSKDLPQKDILFQHLVNSFKENKAELCEPIVPGSVYLREIMRDKARVRHNQKQAKMTAAFERRRKIQKAPPRLKPRTMKELKAALERQRMEEEEVERRILLEEVRAREADEFRKMELNTINLKNFVVQFQDPVLMGHDGFNNNNSNSKQVSKPEDQGIARERTFITEIDERETMEELEKEMMMQAEVQSNPEGSKKSSKKKKKQQQQPAPPPQPQRLDSEDELLLDEDGDPLSVSRQGFIDDVKKLEEQSRAESKMRFVTALMRKGVKVPENPQYRDWETSDRSVAYLEERIKRFAKKHGESDEVIKILPKLRRFEESDESLHRPMPGGRCIVKTRARVQRNSQRATNDHNNHTSYNMVPSIPHYEQLKKAKMVFQKDLESKREQWMKATE